MNNPSTSMHKYSAWLLAVIVCVVSMTAPINVMADGLVVDKVYSPYVNPIEREIEFRSIFVQDNDAALDGYQQHQLGFAHAFAERFRGELYLIGVKTSTESLVLEGYEAELKWQLTEQGEFFADWGLLFELELDREEDIQEFRTAVLVEKELGQWTGKLNISGLYEWGDDISNELETQLAAQLRYRYKRLLEPAVELYAGQEFKGLGPVAVGSARLGSGRKLRWEAGIIFGIESNSADQVWRAMLEYEF